MSKTPFEAGDQVEIDCYDFRRKTDNEYRPRVGTVEQITPLDDGLFDVSVRKPDGHIKIVRVGPRGGGLKQANPQRTQQ